MTRSKQTQGLSLVEVMISTSIILIAILGANMQYFQQMKAQGHLKLLIQARGILNQTVSQVRSNAADYPAFFSSEGTSITYISCFNDRGGQLPATSPCKTGDCSTTLAPLGYFVTEKTTEEKRKKLSEICTNADIIAAINRVSNSAIKPAVISTSSDSGNVNWLNIDVHIVPRGARNIPPDGQTLSAEVLLESTI